MPVWNGERYLREAIESILAQTFQDFEFIILDDGSTDSTLKVLAEYEGNLRVRVIRLEHGGIVHALNRGIAEAKADWIARMDCDDVAEPERLEEQWRAVSRCADAVLCHTNIRLIGDRAYFPPKLPHFPRTEAILRIRLCFQCPIIHPSTLLRKEALLAAGGYKPEERHAEDYALWGRMLPLGRFVGISRPLLNLRVHGGSISKQAAAAQLQLCGQIRAAMVRDVFRADAERAGLLFKQVTGEMPGFGPSESLALFGLLVTHHLLNAETLIWWILNSFRRLAYK